MATEDDVILTDGWRCRAPNRLLADVPPSRWSEG
jgi:hypothetical protein